MLSLKSFTFMLNKNKKVLLLLLGILLVTMAIQFFMFREGFESAIASSMSKALDEMDDQSKDKIIQEIKDGIDSTTQIMRNRVDEIMPCLLRKSNCPNGLQYSMFGGIKGVPPPEVLPSDVPSSDVPPETSLPEPPINQQSMRVNQPPTNDDQTNPSP